jgi:hypothetical protein
MSRWCAAFFVFISLNVCRAGEEPALANQDPVYVKLRDLQPTECFVVENLSLERDAAVFLFRSGKVCPTPPVEGRVTSAVFLGDGQFTLRPSGAFPGHAQHYMRTAGIDEPFTEAAFLFTDDTYTQLRGTAKSTPLDERAAAVLRNMRGHVRGGLEHYERLENLDAEILAGLYNPQRPLFFRAYLKGQKHSNLRFAIHPGGRSGLEPEEVTLENHEVESEKGGVLYMSHLQSELKAGTASSDEDKSFVRGESYTIDTTVAGNDRLAGNCTVGFRALHEGERVVHFALASTLRVSRVAMDGKDLPFIQEDHKHDAAFHVIFPEPLPTGKSRSITVSYEGDKVVRKAGGGNFWVEARTSWYPNVNSFLDRARFDLTFHYPKHYTLISVGKLEKESKNGGQNVSHWVSDAPLPVAGFNFGEYKKKQVEDESTKYSIEGYATLEVPDFLKPKGAELPEMDRPQASDGLRDQLLVPSALNEKAITEARAAVQVFTHYFGPLPYGRIAITQQPAMNWGQSWPTLVYLPIIAYLDPTQRLHLLGGIDTNLNEFVDEVNPHEVSHQWWAYLVGWKTFHDQWLSEGFAFFSAGLFLQATQQTDKYLTYWQHARNVLLEKNQFGNTANDAGPVWMGQLLTTAHNEQAYDLVVYRKGGYVLHMLRMMMWEPRNGDAAFIQMMHDFVDTYRHKSATTEDFQQIVEKHMTPGMNLGGNGKMDWFFNEWVYGTEIPSYSLDYTLTPGQDGKTVLKLKVTQGDVGPNFKMPVGVYVDYDGKLVRLGLVPVTGSATSPEATVNLARKPARVVLNANYDVLAYK